MRKQVFRRLTWQVSIFLVWLGHRRLRSGVPAAGRALLVRGCYPDIMAESVDRLRIARGLREAGIDRDQAEAHAAALRGGQANLVTKVDLAEFKGALRDDMAQLEMRLIKWMVGQGVATIGLIVAAIKLLS